MAMNVGRNEATGVPGMATGSTFSIGATKPITQDKALLSFNPDARNETAGGCSLGIDNWLSKL